MSIIIESSIPVTRSHMVKVKYPWYDMKVGDSFLIEIPLSTKKGLHSCANRAGIKISVRQIRKHGNIAKYTGTKQNFYRVWRIK